VAHIDHGTKEMDSAKEIMQNLRYKDTSYSNRWRKKELAAQGVLENAKISSCP